METMMSIYGLMNVMVNVTVLMFCAALVIRSACSCLLSRGVSLIDSVENIQSAVIASSHRYCEPSQGRSNLLWEDLDVLKNRNRLFTMAKESVFQRSQVMIANMIDRALSLQSCLISAIAKMSAHIFSERTSVYPSGIAVLKNRNCFVNQRNMLRFYCGEDEGIILRADFGGSLVTMT